MLNRPQHWKPESLIKRISQDEQTISWLTTQGSLTQRLKAQCEQLKVIVLSEKYELPLVNEQNALKMAPTQQAWIRCVLLQCAENKWVYARTVIPNMQTDNPWASLQKLGNKPLGEVLFEMPSIQRTPFAFADLALSTWPHLAPHLPQTQNRQNSVARRSVFIQTDAPLLLTEVFLPGLFDK